jgi:hypothetical protein
LGVTGGAALFLILGVASTRGRVAAVIIGGMLLVLAWRLWVAGIQVTGDGVKVGTLFLSRRVSWHDIDHFAALPLGRYPYVGCVVLRDGRKFGTFGLSTSAFETEANRLRVQRPIDELN